MLTLKAVVSVYDTKQVYNPSFPGCLACFENITLMQLVA